MRADPPSHTFATTKTPGASCRVRKRMAFSCWFVITRSRVSLACFAGDYRLIRARSGARRGCACARIEPVLHRQSSAGEPRARNSSGWIVPHRLRRRQRVYRVGCVYSGERVAALEVKRVVRAGAPGRALVLVSARAVVGVLLAALTTVTLVSGAHAAAPGPAICGKSLQQRRR